jgi:phytoene dehydrogenase-like protein
VEKNGEPGGLMCSYSRLGIDCPVGVHYVGALGASEPLGKMFRVLGIDPESLFSRMENRAVTDRYIFDDFVFDLPEGLDAYEKNLREACRTDGAALDTLMNGLRTTAGVMASSPFFFDGGSPFSNMDSFRPMGELLDELGASPKLRAVLAAPCQLIGVELKDCPVIFYQMVVAGYLFSAWRPKSGRRLADAFAARFEELGGRLLLGSAVRHVRTQQGRVTAVDLEEGDSLPADAVVAAIHPKILVGLLDQDALKASLRERIAGLEETNGVLAVQAGVDAQTHPAVDYNLYRLRANDRGEIENGFFYQVLRGNGRETNLLSIITLSHYRDWSRWENTVTGQRGEAYEQKKKALADALTAQASDVLGPLKNLRLLDVFTPLSLRDFVNCPEGSCYGVLRSSRQLLKIASLGKLPVGGLYLAGQNALAPGLMGCLLGSFGVARKMAGHERFGKELERLL